MAGNFYSWVKDERVLKNPSAKCTSPHPESCPYHGTKKLDKTDEVDKGAGGGADDVAKMDAAYADAVKRGDRETALRMIREEAKNRGFGIEAWHGTDLDYFNKGKRFTVFEEQNHFGTKEVAESVAVEKAKETGGKAPFVYHVFIKSGKTKTVSDVPADWNETHSEWWWQQGREAIKDGYDCLAYANKYEDENSHNLSYVPLSNKNIKSADIEYDDDGNLIPLSKRFDDGDDIRGDVGKKRDEAKSPMDDDAEMDRQYEAAVKRGDIETCAMMLKARAKKMMPNTKVVDENGDPKKVWHGGSFTKDGKYVPNTDGGEGMHFGTEEAAYDRVSGELSGSVDKGRDGLWHLYDGNDEDYGDAYTTKLDALRSFCNGHANVRPYFLNIDKITGLRDDAAEDWFDIVRQAKDVGDNGIAYKNDFEDFGSVSYVAFEPSQIKSADPITYDDNGAVIPLSKRFDFSNPDIRY